MTSPTRPNSEKPYMHYCHRCGKHVEIDRYTKLCTQCTKEWWKESAK